MKLKILYWSITILYTTVFVLAGHRGGRTTPITPNPTGISASVWIIFLVLFLGVGYFIYWVFSKNKKRLF